MSASMKKSKKGGKLGLRRTDYRLNYKNFLGKTELID